MIEDKDIVERCYKLKKLLVEFENSKRKIIQKVVGKIICVELCLYS